MATVNEDDEQEFAPQKKKPLSEDEKRKKKIVVGSLMKALIRPGGGDSGPSNSDQVLEANPAHVKGLYGRGMVYMGNGDFEEARADFKMMQLLLF
ncbi:peptidyl-prolyl cis-trans isomerase PASTICCINO1 isoform X2 [Medicago truncatula]|nr:peptidyl-prolyl cis-trans isomerase PASTICCINO1-like isoform X2 [Medicago truncatula]